MIGSSRPNNSRLQSHFVFASFILCAALTLSACSGGSVNTTPVSAVNPALQAALQQDVSSYLGAQSAIEHTSGVSVSIGLHGLAPLDIVAGTTQIGVSQPMTASSVFQLGSQTKAMTAVEILQLEAAGKLGITDTVGKWLPQYPLWANVTIKELLNMTSGLPSYSGEDTFQRTLASAPNAIYTPAQLIAMVYPMAPMTAPGAAFDYSNTNYILAQMIATAASPGAVFDTQLQAIIASAGMTSSTYSSTSYPASVLQTMPAGYFANDAITNLHPLLYQRITTYNLSWAQGAGSAVGTIDDLTKWARALYDGTLVAGVQHQELLSIISTTTGQSIPTTSASEPNGFGLGVVQDYDPTLGVYWNYLGTTLGFRTLYVWLPASDTFISIGVNSQPPSGTDSLSSRVPNGRAIIKTLYATLHSFGKV